MLRTKPQQVLQPQAVVVSLHPQMTSATPGRAFPADFLLLTQIPGHAVQPETTHATGSLGTEWRVTAENRLKEQMTKGSKVETGVTVKVQVPKATAAVVTNVSCYPEVCHEVMLEDAGAVLMEKASMVKLHAEQSAL